MLDTPKYGWSKITIGKWSDHCSYLDDVPFMLLESLELSCRTHKPAVAKFDAEGYEYILVFDWLSTYVISPDKEEFVTIDICRDDLVKELVFDIRNDIEAWANWAIDPSEDEIEERKKDLAIMCDILEKRIPSDDWKLVYRKEEKTDGK